jgi:hypothetical protein
VYVREAHPTDGAFTPGGEAVGAAVRQPRDLAERTEVATVCCSKLKITMPMVVDTIDDRVGHAYSGMPDRLYVIDSRGEVAYQGGRGPFGFRPGEMEQSLVTLLLEEGRGAASPPLPRK